MEYSISIEQKYRNIAIKLVFIDDKSKKSITIYYILDMKCKNINMKTKEQPTIIKTLRL